MYNHYRGKRKHYEKKVQGDKKLNCTFCEDIQPEQIVRETEHCLLIKNRLPYDLWEHHKVLSHLLVVPKRHVATLGELTEAELLDSMRLSMEHESQGYSIYARASDSPRRSVTHQHTHLIQIAPQVKHAGLYLKKPYVIITV